MKIIFCVMIYKLEIDISNEGDASDGGGWKTSSESS
jgi:hypothetical protein